MELELEIIRSIPYICISHCIAIIFSTMVLTVFYGKFKNDIYSTPFIVMELSIIGWMIFKILKTVSPTLALRWSFVVSYYLCICIFEVALFLFTYSYYYQRRINNKVKIILYAVSISQYLIIFTNPYHHLYYSYFNFWADDFGKLVYIHVFISYTIILISLYFGAKAFRRSIKEYSLMFKISITIIILFPLAVNVLYITQVFNKICQTYGIVLFDFSPISYSIMFIIFIFVTTNYRLIDLKPIDKYEIIDEVEEGVVIVNEDRDIIYSNNKAKELLPGERLNKFKKTINRLDHFNDFLILDIEDTKLHIKYKSEIIKQRRFVLIIIRDISRIIEVENRIFLQKESIYEKNETLKTNISILRKNYKFRARKYIAGELHDIIGHSLVVCIKMLETSLIYLDIDKEKAKRGIKLSSKALEEGVFEINSLQDNLKNGLLFKESVFEIFNKLDFTGIESKVYLKGDFSKISDDLTNSVRQICKEAVTNIIKHSGATKAFANINVVEKNMYIKIMDNGCGIDHLHLGNGLRGIKNRVESLKGDVDFQGEKGEGFSIIVALVI